MSRVKKTICLCMALSVFGLIAMGSGSSDKKNNSSNNSSNNGGSSSKVEVTTTAAPVSNYVVGNEYIMTDVNSLGMTWIRVSVPVTNTGETNLYLSSGSIDIENAEGTLQQVLKMVGAYPQVLKPGETGYYCEYTTYEGKDTTGLKAVPHVDVDPAKVDCIRLEASDLQLKDNDYTGVSVIGRIENKGEEDAKLVRIVAFLYDADGNMIGETSTILTDTVPKGDKVGFETSSLFNDLKAADVSKFEVYAYPNQYQF